MPVYTVTQEGRGYQTLTVVAKSAEAARDWEFDEVLDNEFEITDDVITTVEFVEN